MLSALSAKLKQYRHTQRTASLPWHWRIKEMKIVVTIVTVCPLSITAVSVGFEAITKLKIEKEYRERIDNGQQEYRLQYEHMCYDLFDNQIEFFMNFKHIHPNKVYIIKEILCTLPYTNSSLNNSNSGYDIKMVDEYPRCGLKRISYFEVKLQTDSCMDYTYKNCLQMILFFCEDFQKTTHLVGNADKSWDMCEPLLAISHVAFNVSSVDEISTENALHLRHMMESSFFKLHVRQ
uniref:Uncharacterized protein n=1 Tax=Glossina austeni TaxID=7395 RepID=A0A1A9UXP1_GLOAU